MALEIQKQSFFFFVSLAKKRSSSIHSRTSSHFPRRLFLAQSPAGPQVRSTQKQRTFFRRRKAKTRGLAFSFQYTYTYQEEDVEKNDDETFDGIHALSSDRFFLLFCCQRRSTQRFHRVVCVVPVNFFALFSDSGGRAKCDEVARQ